MYTLPKPWAWRGSLYIWFALQLQTSGNLLYASADLGRQLEGRRRRRSQGWCFRMINAFAVDATTRTYLQFLSSFIHAEDTQEEIRINCMFLCGCKCRSLRASTGRKRCCICALPSLPLLCSIKLSSPLVCSALLNCPLVCYYALLCSTLLCPALVYSTLLYSVFST